MLPAVITALLSLGSTVSAQQPSPLEHCVQDHVHQLLELSDWTVEQKLLNDAERLLGTARRLVPGDSNAGERAEQLRELRTGINRDRQLRDAPPGEPRRVLQLTVQRGRRRAPRAVGLLGGGGRGGGGGGGKG